MSEAVTTTTRRNFIRLSATAAAAYAATSLLPASIQAALAIPANRRTGTLQDVEHVVILMQENRSFDHYFGTLKGVRGFGDRITIPLPDGDRVWQQKGILGAIPPYHFDTKTTSAQRVEGTPHTWPDAQLAWSDGRMDMWQTAKTVRSLGYYQQQDIEFQFALANAFTIADAYHCSFQGGTNPNRLFLWSGTNDASGAYGGPVTTNDHDGLGPVEQGYRWTTYPERLQAAGVSWRIYQDMADNFSDNPLVGFSSFRAASPDSPLHINGLSTWTLEHLRDDVLNNRLPQVSWLVAPAKYSEHPGPSCPAWGAQYTAQVLDVLTTNPEVWSKTVLLLMFDENDGFFDHMPPPAPPSIAIGDLTYGKSSIDTTGEYHLKGDLLYRQHPYGLGPRVPMYAISPWSKGGWVNSQVFDHTSVIRFLESRFGVMEPNISPWRRAVCGDLTSLFDFSLPNDAELPRLPDTSQADALVASQSQLPKPHPPLHAQMPVQEMGARPARALPYQLQVHSRYLPGYPSIVLNFINSGQAAAVLHVYDRHNPLLPPRRFTVAAGALLSDRWLGNLHGDYDLEVFGPNGFMRCFQGNLRRPLKGQWAAAEVRIDAQPGSAILQLQLTNRGTVSSRITVKDNLYRNGASQQLELAPGASQSVEFDLHSSANWYDFSIRAEHAGNFLRRLSGHLEDGRPSFSDPGMGLGQQMF
jgi:phospholipase C